MLRGREEAKEMSFVFCANRAVQASAYIINHRARQTTKLELVKLLYFADRLSIQKQGCPITGDDLYALDHGPIVSRILDLINDSPLTSSRDRVIWSSNIEIGQDHVLYVKHDPGNDELSEYEIELLDEILRKYGHLTASQLIHEAHELPEWIKCHVDGASKPILLSEIAKAVGRESDLPDMEGARELDLELAQLRGG
jgi:uncharacterized phage-associated protein